MTDPANAKLRKSCPDRSVDAFRQVPPRLLVRYTPPGSPPPTYRSFPCSDITPTLAEAMAVSAAGQVFPPSLECNNPAPLVPAKTWVPVTAKEDTYTEKSRPVFNSDQVVPLSVEWNTAPWVPAYSSLPFTANERICNGDSNPTPAPVHVAPSSVPIY